MFFPRDTLIPGGYYDPLLEFGPFFASTAVRGTWVAFFVFWILWALVQIARNIFAQSVTRQAAGSEMHERTGETARTVPRDEVPGGTKMFDEYSMSCRLDRVQGVLRDLLLSLLAALTINTFGRGGTSSVEVLTWIFLGVAIVWTIFELGFDNRIIRVIFSSILYGINLVIFILAFAAGWRF
ncbi:hypothetical protein BC936DRAFT_149502 [Jimgerdemannia flammicorona]|uniref:Uncharacterized protein n=2 Tax=Jimgerdemannia flammicorona TaxID=994334 RepID=A0A433DK71_9FUNG|nr:hypothetical protein BC936DRAFT_149502 [Jimgerdemannia flammicorona]RUS22902.1 hypothetical protein BC938DRAFT_475169 [Jimgerdemannia flammicorona]